MITSRVATSGRPRRTETLRTRVNDGAKTALAILTEPAESLRGTPLLLELADDFGSQARDLLLFHRHTAARCRHSLPPLAAAHACTSIPRQTRHCVSTSGLLFASRAFCLASLCCSVPRDLVLGCCDTHADGARARTSQPRSHRSRRSSRSHLAATATLATRSGCWVSLTKLSKR